MHERTGAMRIKYAFRMIESGNVFASATESEHIELQPGTTVNDSDYASSLCKGARNHKPITVGHLTDIMVSQDE